MNILHLNTYTHKQNLSFPHYQFHKDLLEVGENSIVLSASGDVNEKEIIFLNRGGFFPWFGISRIIRKVLFELFIKNDTRYFYPEWNLDYITKKHIIGKLPFKPDVIITYWTKFAFNQKLIYQLSKTFNAPIVTFMMDMAPLTGGCHYAFGCKRYQVKCGKCPALNSSKERDLSRISWEFKKKYIDKTNITLVACSSTLERQVSKSSLFTGKQVERLMLSVDENNYKPKPKEKARQHFNIPSNKKIIFFGAASLNEKRKGMIYLIEALEILSKMIKKSTLKEKIYILVAGKDIPKLDIPFEYKYVGYLKTQQELALAYQACDLFVCPSIEDSGPLMITQSIMSGRPVVSFNMGVAPDLVHTGNTGYRAKLKDSEDLAQGLAEILRLNDESWNRMSKECRTLGLDLCSASSQVQKLREILDGVIKT